MTTLQLYDHDLEAELGSQCALATRDFEICLNAGLRAEHFTTAFGAIYSVVHRMYIAGHGIDPTSVLAAMTREERERVGGRDQLVKLCSEGVYAYASELSGKARRIVELSRLRSAWQGVQETFLDHSKLLRAPSVSNALQVIASDLMAEDESEIIPAAKTIETAEQKIERVSTGEQGYLIPTGFRSIDFFLGGFRKGELYGLAGHMKSGKTMLGLQIADQIARRGTGVLVVSLEMSDQELAYRMAGWHDSRFADRVSAGVLDSEALRLWRGAKPYAFPGADHMHFATKTQGRWKTIEAIVTRAARTLGVEFVLIDYLSLIQLPASRDQHAIRMAQMTASLKQLAARTETAILVLSQYNRDAFERYGKHGDGDITPRISDIYGSSGLEKDAYSILLLDTPWSVTRQPPGETAMIHVPLNRAGGTGYRELDRSRVGAFYDPGQGPSAHDVSGGTHTNGRHG